MTEPFQINFPHVVFGEKLISNVFFSVARGLEVNFKIKVKVWPEILLSFTFIWFACP